MNRKEYMKKWAQENKDKIQAASVRYWERVGERTGQTAEEARRTYQREWARRNKDKVRAAEARYWRRKLGTADVGGLANGLQGLDTARTGTEDSTQG